MSLYLNIIIVQGLVFVPSSEMFLFYILNDCLDSVTHLPVFANFSFVEQTCHLEPRSFFLRIIFRFPFVEHLLAVSSLSRTIFFKGRGKLAMISFYFLNICLARFCIRTAASFFLVPH